MALDAAQIDGDFIAQCRALLITGTHLSTPTVQAASVAALDHAARHGVLRVLDIDYRPVLWGLTKRGEGANRFVPDAAVTERLQAMLPRFDLLIGTEEEFFIAGGVPGDLMASLRAVRGVTAAAMVVKLGAAGCCFIPGAVPERIEDAPTVVGERVEVLNVLGAGDAFAAGLLNGLLRGQSFEEAARLANACGAIVVSRHACSAAMPTPAELTHWFSGRRNCRASMPTRSSRTCTVPVPARKQWPQPACWPSITAAQFFDLARQAGTDGPPAALKQLLVQAAEPASSAAMPAGPRRRAHRRMSTAPMRLAAATGRGWWLGRPVELPLLAPAALRRHGCPSLARSWQQWPAEQVVKCLVHYHPDDPAPLRLEQEARIGELWEATRASGHDLLLELIPPADKLPAEDTDNARDTVVLRSIERLYNLGFRPEWWKLSPMAPAAWDRLAQLVAERDPQCRGVVILGLNQPLAQLVRGFAEATNPIVKGFMIGRTLWIAPGLRWLRQEIDDDALVKEVAGNFAELVEAWDGSHS
jgi:5-dehydro-2-deoxygluconokinase